MTLSEIKAYLTQVKIASMTTLCAYFKCDAEQLRCMMMHWIRKGKVRTLSSASSCASCTSCVGCVKSSLEIYEWTSA